MAIIISFIIGSSFTIISALGNVELIEMMIKKLVNKEDSNISQQIIGVIISTIIGIFFLSMSASYVVTYIPK
jgi:hypothetical protein